MDKIFGKCTNCGANLEINSENTTFECKYCGAKQLKQEAIVNFNTTNNYNIQSGSTINIGYVTTNS